MKIVESITADYALNQSIEQKLEHLSAEDRTKVRDGLEIVMNAGETGVNVSEYVRSMRVVWPTLSTDDAKRIFNIMRGDFGDLVSRRADGQYIWSMPNNDAGGVDMASPLAQQAKMTIEMTAHIQQLMRDAVTFTADEIVGSVCADSEMPVGMAQMVVQHVIDNTAATVKPNGDGSYSWHAPLAKTGLSFLRDLDGYEPRG